LKHAFAALLLVFVAASAQALPSFDEVRAAHRPSDVTVVDRHGEPLQTLRVDHRVRRLPWVPLAELSPALLQAVVESEDRRFWEHSGVDWGAVAASAFGNLFDRRTRGASTVTMQLAGLIDDGLARPAGGRSVAQKIGQVLVATQLEARWSKSRILEAYLNSVPLRGELVGVNALAQTLFGKHPSGLDVHEAAIAAVLIRAPNAPADAVARRACALLAQRGQACEGVTALAANALVRRGGMPLGPQIAPHLARRIVVADGPAVQRSTLDAGLQRVAIASLRRQIAELQGRNVDDGAVVVLDNASGEVLAWVGSSGDFSDAAQVDGVLARRQPGSTMKPFVYGLAFEQRLITPASLLDDRPTQIATGGGLYAPRNYDGGFKGRVSARTALASSLNIPAVQVGAMVGPDALFERLNAFGLALSHSAGWHGQALALGAADVTLLGLANAYRTLANGGRHREPVLKPGAAPPPARAVADPAATYLVTQVLADNSARAATFGLDSALATRGFAAVKTGTSKDLRDNWCVGFTDRFTVAAWVGNASGAPMHGVSGISGAAPVWREVVEALHAGRPSRRPAPPAGVVTQPVRYAAGTEPARDEVFLAGTAQAVVHDGARAAFGIVAPRDGSVFALDPDIPVASQRLVFEGEAGVWLLDGRRLGRGERIEWRPRPGRHVLALAGPDGRVLQQVRFEVR
jgi:penicillin-binding protein 1C